MSQPTAPEAGAGQPALPAVELAKDVDMDHADAAGMAVDTGDVGSPSLRVPDSDAVPVPDVPEEWINMSFKWSGKTYELRQSTSDLIYDLRTTIESLTGVPPAAQKVLGLGRTQLRPESDGARIATLGLKDGVKFTLVGTPEHLRFKEPEVSLGDEWDLSYPARGQDGNVVPPAVDPRNLRCVQQIIKKRPIVVMNEPRPGKRLLVLDLDYTIADTRPLLDGALPPLECARPGLHEFLDLVYAHYDIVVWSQTRWVWLESKLVELEVLGAAAEYKICFVADRTTMFPIFSQRSGQMVKHEFPHWSAKNTIHIDDLARNFALNPGEGLRIRAFKGAGTPEGDSDRELKRLGHYLVDIATNVDDFTTIDHSQWKRRVNSLRSNSSSSRKPEGPAGPTPSGGAGQEGSSG